MDTFDFDEDAEPPRANTIWSAELGKKLLSYVPAQELLRYWSARMQLADDGGNRGERAKQFARDLLAVAVNEEEIRDWLRDAWRAEHSGLIAALDSIWHEELTGIFDRLVDQYGAEPVVFAWATSPAANSWEEVQEHVAGLQDIDKRRECERVLDRVCPPSTQSAAETRRIAVVGGHPKEERRMAQMMEARGFEVVWQCGVKNKGRMAGQRWIGRVKRVSAIIIITGRVSHAMMDSAKRFAQSNTIPVWCVARASLRQLEEVLDQIQKGGLDGAGRGTL